MAGLAVALLSVPAAGLLVVTQWEAWVRGDQWLTKDRLTKSSISRVWRKCAFLSSGSSCFLSAVFLRVLLGIRDWEAWEGRLGVLVRNMRTTRMVYWVNVSGSSGAGCPMCPEQRVIVMLSSLWCSIAVPSSVNVCFAPWFFYRLRHRISFLLTQVVCTLQLSVPVNGSCGVHSISSVVFVPRAGRTGRSTAASNVRHPEWPVSSPV